MFSRIRKRMTYANVALTLALVFAMSGGAYAAGKYMITSTKQISPKVLKSLKGANGKNGAAGAAGAQGAQGPQGAAGAKGETGAAGATGAKGETGATGAAGTNGTNGKEGSPWTLNGTLPSGKTEKGTWAIAATAAGAGDVFSYAFSFPIPLGAKIEEANIGLFGLLGPTPTESPECPGGVAKPEATPGHFCVFAGRIENAAFVGGENVQTGGGFTVGETGMVFDFVSDAAGKVEVTGTWAVAEK
jgi:hypothetical protein